MAIPFGLTINPISLATVLTENCLSLLFLSSPTTQSASLPLIRNLGSDETTPPEPSHNRTVHSFFQITLVTF